MKAVDKKEVHALTKELMEDLRSEIRATIYSPLNIEITYKDGARTEDYLFKRLYRYGIQIAARAAGVRGLAIVTCKKCKREFPECWKVDDSDLCPACQDVYNDLRGM